MCVTWRRVAQRLHAVQHRILKTITYPSADEFTYIGADMEGKDPDFYMRWRPHAESHSAMSYGRGLDGDHFAYYCANWWPYKIVEYEKHEYASYPPVQRTTVRYIFRDAYEDEESEDDEEENLWFVWNRVLMNDRGERLGQLVAELDRMGMRTGDHTDMRWRLL